MANIGFIAAAHASPTYTAGRWSSPALALALRFVPYTDNHGHFDPFWTVVMAACLIAAAVGELQAARRARRSSKLLKVRNRQWRRRLGPRSVPRGALVEPEVEGASCASSRPGRSRWWIRGPASSPPWIPTPAKLEAVERDDGEGVSPTPPPEQPARARDTRGS